jgi:hypothetical protein
VTDREPQKQPGGLDETDGQPSTNQRHDGASVNPPVHYAQFKDAGCLRH